MFSCEFPLGMSLQHVVQPVRGPTAGRLDEKLGRTLVVRMGPEQGGAERADESASETCLTFGQQRLEGIRTQSGLPLTGGTLAQTLVPTFDQEQRYTFCPLPIHRPSSQERLRRRRCVSFQ